MRRPAWCGTALAAGAQLAAVGLLLTSGWLIVRAAQQPPVLYLMVAIVGVRFFGIGRAALRYAERLVTHDDALARAVDDRVSAYRALVRGGVGALGGRRTGDVVRRVVSDVDQVQDGYLRLRVPWTSAVAAWLVVTLVAGLVEPWAGVALGVQGIVTLTLLRLVVHRLVRPEDDDVRGTLAADMTEVVRAAPDLVALGVAPSHRASADVAVDALARRDRRGAWATGLGQAVVLAVGAVSAVGCLLLADRPSPALAAVVALAPLAVLDVFLAVAEAERLRPAVAAARARLAALQDVRPLVEEPSDAGTPRGFDLSARGLAVGWPGSAPVARGIDLDVPEGSVVAVTAPSGGGKSTLALTIARQLPVVSGSLSLGRVELADVSGDDVRRVVGLMSQDEPVLDTTLRENLRVARPTATDADMLDVLRRVGLGPLLRSSDSPLDLRVGEQGSRLSGGERQRLALARLLLAGHRLLVLDEPTEHLDEDAARALLDDVLSLAPRCTVVILTHSAAVIERVDHVVRLGPVAQRPVVARVTG